MVPLSEGLWDDSDGFRIIVENKLCVKQLFLKLNLQLVEVKVRIVRL